MEIGLEALRLYYNGQKTSRDRWASANLNSGTLANVTTSLLPSTSASASHHVTTTNSQSQYNSSFTLSDQTTATAQPLQPSNNNNFSLFAVLSNSTVDDSLDHLSQRAFISALYPVTLQNQVNVSPKNDDSWTSPPDVPMIVNVHRFLLDVLGNHTNDSSLVFNNGTNGSLGLDSGDDLYNSHRYHWVALIAIACILAGLVGNVLVCLAVATDKRLQTPTNYFLLSLALADLFVSVLVMPIGMIVEVMGYWPFNFSTCLVYTFSDIFCCTASIMHMCMISIDRYMGISRPLTHRTRSVKFDIGMKILGVWLVSMAVSCPVLLVSVFHDEATVVPAPLQCTLNNRVIMIVGSLVAFFIPQIVMGIAMTKTLLLLRLQAKWSAGKRGCHVPRVAVKRVSTPATTDGLLDGKTSTGRSNSQPSTATVKKQSNGVTHNVYTNVAQPDVASASDSQEEEPGSSNSPIRTPNAQKAGKMVAAVNLLNRKNKQKKARQIDSEKKATTVLGLVFGIFCLCWTPFFIMNTVYALCGDRCNIPDWPFTLFLWLGWISSTVNPMIYTVVNPIFRQAFIRLLGMGAVGERCRGAVRVSVQNFRGTQPEDPKALVVRRASKYPGANKAISWSPTFLTALELNNETPV